MGVFDDLIIAVGKPQSFCYGSFAWQHRKHDPLVDLQVTNEQLHDDHSGMLNPDAETKDSLFLAAGLAL